MSLLLPPQNHQARALIDVAHLAELGSTGTWPTFNEARYSARRTFKNQAGVKAVHCVCMRANGDIHLVRFGPRGGWKKIWNFSK